MADKNNQSNLFQNILDVVIKRNKGFERGEQPIGSQAMFDPRGAGSREEAQQNFLDWQMRTVASDLYERSMNFGTDRIGAYHDYRAMDHSPEVSKALSIMRDECLTQNEYGEVLQIYSDQERVKEALVELFTNRLNINEALSVWIREMLKWGDYFVYLHIDKDSGVMGYTNIHPSEVNREEGYNEDLGAVRFRLEGSRNMILEEWQMSHFRLIDDSERLPYGRSVIDAARKTWKQLQLAEDSMLVYRLTRSPDRKVFYVEVGNLDPNEIQAFIQQIQKSVKKAPTVDMRNGQRDFKYNPMNITEDYFMPVRGDHHSKIDTLPGASNMADIADIEYLENKLFCSLGVPKAYLNYSEGIQGGSTLSQTDIRFARTINRFQETILMELRKIAKVHLFAIGFKEDFENFSLKLNNPSTQMELMKLEIMKARLEVGKEWFTPEASSFTSWTWVMENIMGFSKNDIKKILKQKKVEKKMFAEIDSASETYRKTGIFKDIDQKYEIAGAPPNGGTNSEDGGGEDGGFNGSSALGGGMDDGMPEMPDMGGDTPDAGGAPAPSNPPAGGGGAADMALGESKIRLDNIIDELFEEDAVKRQERVIVEKRKNRIMDSGSELMRNADTLFNKLEKKFGDIHMSDRKRKDIIKEAIFVESNGNPLLDSYNEQSARINELNEVFEEGLPLDDIIEEVNDEEDKEHQ